jgi:nitronate monooxygenase
MLRLPALRIGPIESRLPIIQGGMGVGVSLSRLAASVANEGGIGVIATAGIGLLDPNAKLDLRSADVRVLEEEIHAAREQTTGPIGVNVMLAASDFDQLMLTSVQAGVDVIFMGAGLPLKVPATLTPERMRECHTQFVPKISSARAARLILKYWSQQYGIVPAAFVVEGPMAGGHLGFRREQINDPQYALEKLVPEVVAAVAPYRESCGRDIPIIAAGGVFTGEDIHTFLELGAAGVKMGTRFVGTHECDAHQNFKLAYVHCKKEDIVIIESPVGLLGRAITNDFLAEVAKGAKIPFHCPWHCLKPCDVKRAPYCIAQALKSARLGDFVGGFAFAGSNAFRVAELVSVKSLMNTLVQEFEAAVRAHAVAV